MSGHLALLSEADMARLLWPSSRYPSPKLRVFVDVLARHPFPA